MELGYARKVLNGLQQDGPDKFLSGAWGFGTARNRCSCLLRGSKYLITARPYRVLLPTFWSYKQGLAAQFL